MGKPTTFKSGDIRTYELASDSELQGETQDLRNAVNDPKVPISDNIGNIASKSIIYGATVGPLAGTAMSVYHNITPGGMKRFDTPGAHMLGNSQIKDVVENLQKKLAKAPTHLEKLKTLVTEVYDEKATDYLKIHDHDNFVSKAEDLVKKSGDEAETAAEALIKDHITSKDDTVLKKVFGLLEKEGEAVTEGIKKLSDEIISKKKKITYGTAAVAGLAVTVPAVISAVNKQKPRVAMDNASKLSHAERILDERTEAENSVSDEPSIS